MILIYRPIFEGFACSCIVLAFKLMINVFCTDVLGFNGVLRGLKQAKCLQKLIICLCCECLELLYKPTSCLTDRTNFREHVVLL